MLMRILWIISIVCILSVYTLLVCQFDLGLLFAPTPLGFIYDGLSQSLLTGSTTVPSNYLRFEAFTGRTGPVTYFGPLPAIFRIFTNYFFPDLFGKWTRVYMIFALIIMLWAKFYLASYYAKNSQKLRLVFFLGLTLGTPVMLVVTQVAIYNEAIIWGYAFACWALYFLLRILDQEKPPKIHEFIGFSVASGAALLARVTFALPFFLASLLLLSQLILKLKKNPIILNCWKRQLLALCLPILCAGLFQLWYNFDRYGNYFEFWTQERWIQNQGQQKVILDEYSPYNWKRLPYTILNYYGIRSDYFSVKPPYIHVPYALLPIRSNLFNAPDEIISLSVLSTWLVFSGCLGSLWILFRSKGIFLRLLLFGFAAQQIIILVYFLITHRYILDLLPLHFFTMYIFFEQAKNLRLKNYIYSVLPVMVFFSVCINILATVSYLAYGRTQLPAATQVTLQKLLPNN